VGSGGIIRDECRQNERVISTLLSELSRFIPHGHDGGGFHGFVGGFSAVSSGVLGERALHQIIHVCVCVCVCAACAFMCVCLQVKTVSRLQSDGSHLSEFMTLVDGVYLNDIMLQM